MSDGGHPPRAAVVLVAAGKGERLGGAVAKQFLPLAGRPLFAHSLHLFDALPYVTRLALVLPLSGLPEECRGEVERLAHPLACVCGGARRQDSVAVGLEALSEGNKIDYDVALVHDAARPFPEPDAIERLTRTAMREGGGLLAMRSPDTVKRADAADRVAETLDRRAIWLAQTPQAIRADLVPRAIEALRGPAPLTDEASLLEQWGVPVVLVESSSRNFKVTRPEDLAWAEALLERTRTID